MKLIRFLLALSLAAGISGGAQARSRSSDESYNRVAKKAYSKRTPGWRAKYDRLISKYEQHEQGCPCGTCKSIKKRNQGKRVIKFQTNKSHSRHNKEQAHKKSHMKDEDHNTSRPSQKRISAKKHSQSGHICRKSCASFTYRRPAVIIHSAPRQEEKLYHEYTPSTVKVNKQDYVPSIAVNTFQFDYAVRRRAYFISKEGIADELLADSSSSFDEYLEYRDRTGEVVMAASPENTSRLLTILNDHETYRAYLAFQGGKTDYRVDVVSVVDRDLIVSDPEAAERLALENVSNIENLLGLGRRRNKYSPARMWYNPKYGTVTIINRPEKIEKVKDLMQVRPYYLAQL
jgi:hypothetical protein